MCPPPGLHKFPKEAQRLLRSLRLPSLPGVGTARTPRAFPPLCLVSPRSSLSTLRPLYKTSGPGERGKKKKDHSQLHYILHHSRHLPCSSPSGWEARSPQRAGAKPTQGIRSSTLCAGATQGCARAGEGRGTSPKEPSAQARLGRRAPSASGSRGPASSG